MTIFCSFCIYNYISKGTNNFVKLAVIGGDNHKIPPYTFLNQNNDTITNEDYDGNIYIVDFFFTTCPTICPTMTYNMRYLQKELSIYPNIKFLSHTVNPEYDTPEKLKEYMQWGSIEIEVNLKLGNDAFKCYTCDFTHDYIDINADYRN